MSPEDRVRILDMIEEAENAMRFVAGRRRDDLHRDRMLLHALVRAIEVLGEAASRVSPATRSSAPEIPWRDIVAMRNRLVHAYAAIDPDTVWQTATADIPTILPALRTLAGTDE